MDKDDKQKGAGKVMMIGKQPMREMRLATSCDAIWANSAVRDLVSNRRAQLQMKIHSRRSVSFSWPQAEQIAKHIRAMDGLGDGRREQYSTLILFAAASGLRSSELFALKIDDIDFKASTIRVDEPSDQRNTAK